MRKYWTVHLWRDARRDWPAFTAKTRTVAESDAEQIYNSQKAAKAMLASNRGVASRPLFVARPTLGPRQLLEMWPGPPGLEVWRYEGWTFFWAALVEILTPTRQNGTTRSIADWLEGFVDAQAILENESSWAEFWFSQVQATELPHHWLGVTAQRYQVDAQVTKSSPFDAQHSSYLVDADLFLTADRRYVKTLQDMARDAPFPVARPVRLSGNDRTALAEICNVLEQVD